MEFKEKAHLKAWGELLAKQVRCQPGYLCSALEYPLLTPHPDRADSGRQLWWSTEPGPPPYARPGMESPVLALAWPRQSCYRHLGTKTNGWTLALSHLTLLPIFSLSNEIFFKKKKDNVHFFTNSPHVGNILSTVSGTWELTTELHSLSDFHSRMTSKEPSTQEPHGGPRAATRTAPSTHSLPLPIQLRLLGEWNYIQH